MTRRSHCPRRRRSRPGPNLTGDALADWQLEPSRPDWACDLRERWQPDEAAPYFHVFNPILQGEKFDPDGAYVRGWVPELARLPKA